MPNAVVSGRIRAALERFVAMGGVAHEERQLAGTVSGAMFLVGGLTCVPLAALPGVSHTHTPALLAVAAVAVVWGLCSLLVIDWRHASLAVIHLSVLGGLAAIALAVASSGGATSPTWIYLFFVVVFASYFWQPPIALAYLALCVAVQAAVLLYDPRAVRVGYLARLEIGAPAYLAVAWAIGSGRHLLVRFRTRAEQLAAEQAALRRVAMAVVRGDDSDQIYDLVAHEAASLLRASAAGILRFDSDSEATVMGSWPDEGEERRFPQGTVVDVPPGSDADRARKTHGPVRVQRHPPESTIGRLGYASSIVTPVRVDGDTWGIIAVTASDPDQLTAEDEQRLLEFGDLLAAAITSIDDRAKLAAQASTDPLTGLANHRALHERLGAEISRAVRHGRVLSVALIDIDHFKQVNDYGGHDRGDELLTLVASCLQAQARAEDVLGRIGGDEFVWVMPDTTRQQALVGVERTRRLIAVNASRRFRITVSAGICDTNASSHPAEVVSFADSALYWSKAHGRNRSWIYDPEVTGELSRSERIRRLERSHALLGLQELARAIDAKDPAMREHSVRVSALAAKLAIASGWSSERAILLSEAALVHDVGKVGVPDELLHKTDSLTESERRQMTEHAELAARIAQGVLNPEQVEWIRSHHERPDGSGYPRGLTAAEIPEGAGLLALADAWDVMTCGRPYCDPKSVEDALSECARLAGDQFTREAVGALMKLHATGGIDPLDLGPAPGLPLGGVD